MYSWLKDRVYFYSFCVGIAAQICAVTSQTCCPPPVEQSIDRATFATLRKFIPAYSLYLNESDAHLFPNYGQYSYVRSFSVFYNNVFILFVVHCMLCTWYIACTKLV